MNRTQSDAQSCNPSFEGHQAPSPEHSEGHQITPLSNTTDDRASVEKPWLLRQPIDAAVKAHIAERLKQDPLANYSELALEVGVGKDVVSRIAAKLQSGDNDLADRRLKSFQRQIAKELPMRDRVMIYGKVARGEADPKSAFSQTAVLKRIEELEGIVTAKEKRESSDNAVPTLPVMFQLPENTSIDIGIRIRPGKDKA